MLSEDTTKHVRNSLVTFVTLERSAVFFFLPSCCVNLLFAVRRHDRAIKPLRTSLCYQKCSRVELYSSQNPINDALNRVQKN